MMQSKWFHMYERETDEKFKTNCGSLCICFCLRLTSAIPWRSDTRKAPGPICIEPEERNF